MQFLIEEKCKEYRDDGEEVRGECEGVKSSGGGGSNFSDLRGDDSKGFEMRFRRLNVEDKVEGIDAISALAMKGRRVGPEMEWNIR